MEEKKINGIPLDDEMLEQASGGINTVVTEEVYCPNCGSVTVSTRCLPGIYTCTICSTKHEGKRVLPKPRG